MTEANKANSSKTTVVNILTVINAIVDIVANICNIRSSCSFKIAYGTALYWVLIGFSVITAILLLMSSKLQKDKIGGLAIIALLLISFIIFAGRPENSQTEPSGNQQMEPSISLRYNVLSETSIQFQADVSGADSNQFITWMISDAPGCSITDSGIFTTDGTPCTIEITGSFELNEQIYKDTCKLLIQSTEVPLESRRTVIRYFAELPEGMDTASADFINLKQEYSIYNSKDKAIADIIIDNGPFDCEDESTCGYVFFHWCRGENDAAYYTWEDALTPGHPHNRRGATVQCSDEYGNYNTFSCFYKKMDDIVQPLCYAKDGSGAVWMPNYNVCWDSYWYWMAEIRECTVIIYNSATSVSIDIVQ